MLKKLENTILNFIIKSFKLSPVLVIFAVLVFFKFSVLNAQQDPQYSQYMFNQFAINPAFAGSREAISTTLFYRHQWVGIKDGAPKTQTITIHAPMRNKKMAVGLAIVADQIGPKSSTGILGTYAYRIRLGEGKLAMGLRLGAHQYTFNWNKIRYKDHSDPYDNLARTTKVVLTADAGAYYYTNSAYAGFSVTHLNQGLVNDVDDLDGKNSQLRSHFFFTGGKAWQISEKLIFSPSAMVKYVAKTPVTADINFSFLIQNRFWVGVSVRSGYGASLYAQYYITDKFKFGYAYDLGIKNKLGTAAGGSHEIMLSYDLKISKGPFVSPRYF